MNTMEEMMENAEQTQTTLAPLSLTPEDQLKQKVEVLAAKAVKIAQQLEGYKLLYEEMDNIAEELKLIRGVGALNSVMHGNMAVTVVDNFADTNVVWKPAGVRRFELKVEDAEKYLKRLKKDSK